MQERNETAIMATCPNLWFLKHLVKSNPQKKCSPKPAVWAGRPASENSFCPFEKVVRNLFLLPFPRLNFVGLQLEHLGDGFCTHVGRPPRPTHLKCERFYEIQLRQILRTPHCPHQTGATVCLLLTFGVAAPLKPGVQICEDGVGGYSNGIPWIELRAVTNWTGRSNGSTLQGKAWIQKDFSLCEQRITNKTLYFCICPLNLVMITCNLIKAYWVSGEGLSCISQHKGSQF